MEKWGRARFQPNLPLGENRTYVTGGQEHIELSKEAAKEGMVLLKNENKTLPLPKGARVALFGKGSFDYVKGGGGSGDVATAYVRNLYEGLKLKKDKVQVFDKLADFYRENIKNQYAAGRIPGMTVEPELPTTLVEQAKAYTDTAVVVISRFSGEGWDRKSVILESNDNQFASEREMARLSAELFEDGDFCLTGREKEMLETVKGGFKKVIVVMNVGGMTDTSWFKEDQAIQSVLMAWQGGMEGGLAAAELLLGEGNPSGKLGDTLAASLDDYPSTWNFHESEHYVDYTEDIYVGYRYFETIPGADRKVNYPFGFGLSYTDFEMKCINAGIKEGRIVFRVVVTNTGEYSGKEVVQIYVQAPQGRLGKPSKELRAFAKTRLLLPGESQTVTLFIEPADLASYDDLGKVQKSAYLLEAGSYRFFVGSSVRDGHWTDYQYELGETVIVKQLSQKLTPSSLKKRMLSDGSFEELPQREENDPNACAFEKLSAREMEGYSPAVRGQEGTKLSEATENQVHTLLEVAEGAVSMDVFLSQLSDEELSWLLGGQPNTGVANTFGFGNLPQYGVPNVMTADGPAGLRIHPQCGVNTTAWPCATLLACTWNTEIVRKIGECGAREVKENNIGVWLTPAVNIHRSPLCGRNFEYYSEDPYLTGKLAGAMVQGIQSEHIAASVKHFAFNNKETNRKNSDSRVSERAAREIYLKAFEIIVKEQQPWTVMSSYNMINGHRCSECGELLTGILRDEWGFKGMVTTDWWTSGEHYKETKAGNDVKMGCGYPERLRKAMDLGCLTREEMEICGRRILELLLKID